MIKKIVSSVGIQMIGTLSSLLLVWMIIRFYGASVQGQFVLIKSWIDLVVVSVSFGLPQSFIYAINKLNVSWEDLRQRTFIYIPFIWILGYVATYVWFEYFQSQKFLSILNYILIAITIGNLTGFFLLRSLYLTKNDGNKFALISIMPNLSLFIIYLLSLAVDKKGDSLSLVYMLSSLIALLFTGISLDKHKSADNISNKNPVPWKNIFSNGMNVFIQNIFGALMPLGTYWLMTKYGFNKEEVGVFSIAIYIYLMFTLPLAMIAPIFYNRWSNSKDFTVVKFEILRFCKIGIFLLPILLISYLLVPHILPIVFGKQVIPAIFSAQILLIATFALYYSTIFSCFLLSQGGFSVLSKSMILKVIICFVSMDIFLIFFDKSLVLIAFSWTISEVFMTSILLISIIRKYLR